MTYVDGFLMIVPSKNLSAYQRMSAKAGKLWREHGALQYCECAADDLKWKHGVPFGKRAGAKKGDTVLFSWITFKSRAHRDRVNDKVMADPRLLAVCDGPLLFDVKKMSYGGFRMVVDA